MIGVPSQEAIDNWIRVYIRIQHLRSTGMLDQEIRLAIAAWLSNNLNYDDWVWIGGTDFYFKYQDDATQFKLVWA